MRTVRQRAQSRRWRVRSRITRKAVGRIRLSVYRSNKHIYAQVIDDSKGLTVASASTAEKEVLGDLKKTWDRDAATIVGQKVAERALEAGIDTVVFDRGQYRYHGRVAALAEAAREKGLHF